MLGEPRLNVSILDADISPRLRERLQAQVQTAIRSLPPWSFALLTDRMTELEVAALQLIIEPVHPTDQTQPLGLGEIDGRPAACLRPRIAATGIEWSQDLRYLVAKAIGYLAAPSNDAGFWARWVDAVEADGLREISTTTSPAWEDETDTGLLIELFAAYALRDGHARWSDLPKVQAFLADWRGGIA